MAIEQPAEWFSSVLPEKMKSDPSKSGGFNGTFTFDIKGDTGGQWSVTIDGQDLSVDDGMKDGAEFSIEMKDDNFLKLMNGELNGQQAFMNGLLKFKGNMGTAMKLGGVLG